MDIRKLHKLCFDNISPTYFLYEQTIIEKVKRLYSHYRVFEDKNQERSAREKREQLSQAI